MEKYKLVIGDKNYADEFDVEAYGVFTETQWKNKVKAMKELFEHNGEVDAYFGTNEFLYFTSFKEWQSCLRIKNITEDEAKFLKKSFGPENIWGTGSHAIFALDENFLEENS